jgi:alkylated DNA repair protein alkB homolog 6
MKEPATPASGQVLLPSALEEVKITSMPDSAFYIANFISEEEEQVLLGKVRPWIASSTPEPPTNIVVAKIASAPKPRWRQLTHRRLQTSVDQFAGLALPQITLAARSIDIDSWPSDLIKDALVDAPLPPWLESPVVSRILSLPRSGSEVNVFAESPHGRPNHVLINEYAPGSGISPHKDGAAYYPIVATVSLGSSLCLNLYKSKDDGALDPEPAWRILQEPRSLLITTQSLYHEFLHGIEEVEEDTRLEEATIANWKLLRDPSAFAEGRNAREMRYSLTYRDVLRISKLSRLGAFAKR